MTEATDSYQDCSVDPCDLCKLRAKHAGIFVAVAANGSTGYSAEHLTKFVCGHCIPTHSPAIDVEDEHTQVWEVGSDGWLGPIECMDCGDPIDVVQITEEITEVIPDIDAQIRALDEAHGRTER